MSKQFHLFDFPEREIYVMLKDRFRLMFFKKAIKKYKSENRLTKKIKVSQQFLNDCKNAKLLKKNGTRISTPLWLIKEISKINNINERQIEKNILYIKGRLHSTPVFKPTIPIKENKELFSILGNLLGDGYAGKERNQGNYYNKQKSLVDNFCKNIKFVFGNIKLTKINNNIVFFPRYLAIILSKFYNIKFETFDSRLPENFLYLPKYCLISLIRSFYDDESYVSNRRIELYSANYNLLEDFKKIINKRFSNIKLSNIRKKTKKTTGHVCYVFPIFSNSLGAFNKEIGFNHPYKKQDLSLWLKIKKQNNKTNGIGYTKNQILCLLCTSNLTQREISKNLLIGSSVGKHLKGLINKGLIKIIDKSNTRANIYGLKNGF